ncbi:hypothetical protein COLO4_09786 [Corchorus olitorius]|uniref:Viral late gene transcription factor 3 zinc ribbon domain-containing protein n=1 Tax=Corchorus olitorius TaxID=93759 RepID=A0A1R3KB75_9ROSI|nr:hypothetical protein COLO4_09786 [Corchorus olitorius]
MEASLCTSPISIPHSKPTFPKHPNPTVQFACTQRCNALVGKNPRPTTKVAASIQDVSAIADPARVDITWQIVVGTIGYFNNFYYVSTGFTPFVVAGIEFSKRIIAQRRCEECRGSGLVLRENGYFKCPECGGFLPWQSWKRFFTAASVYKEDETWKAGNSTDAGLRSMIISHPLID